MEVKIIIILPKNQKPANLPTPTDRNPGLLRILQLL